MSAERYFFARVPTRDAPATALVGPFGSAQDARFAIIRDVKDAEDSGNTPPESRRFRIFRVTEEVEAVVTHNIRLKDV